MFLLMAHFFMRVWITQTLAT
uniref:Uncharacterized protein n=1 Tax=Anguilla anguilla TaxID=7936 RepID=A0A0E9SH23_ANGAN